MPRVTTSPVTTYTVVLTAEEASLLAQFRDYSWETRWEAWAAHGPVPDLPEGWGPDTPTNVSGVLYGIADALYDAGATPAWPK